MIEQKEDRRVQRTRSLLYEAMTDLIIEKGYEAITVQDIIDRANVGRSTFYAHFEDKEQLLKGNIDQLRRFVIEQCSMIVTDSDSSRTDEFRFKFSLVMLQHVQSHKRIYKATVGKESGVLVVHHMRLMLAELVREEINIFLSRSESLPVPAEVAVEFVLNTFFTLISWWMDQNMPYPAKEVDRMFHLLTLQGIQSPNKNGG